MTDDDNSETVVSYEIFAMARWRRSGDRLARQLYMLSDSILDIKIISDRVGAFLIYQHNHFKELLDRSKEVQDFCSRCQEIMMDDNPERMERERDWLVASYRKRNEHRKSWLRRLGQY